MRYGDAVKRLAILLCLCVFAASGVSAQTPPPAGENSRWYGYLEGAARERVRDAILAVDTGIVAWQQNQREILGQLESLYVAARRESWSEQRYAAELERIVPDPDLNEVLPDALATLSDTLREEPPPVGSIWRSRAEEWLARVAAVRGVVTGEVDALIGEIPSATEDTGPVAVTGFRAALGVPIPSGFDDAAPGDQITAMSRNWKLLFLCSPDDAASTRLLAALADGVRAVSPTLGSEAENLTISHRERSARVGSLGGYALAALPAIGAHPIVDLTTGESPVSGEGVFARFLAALTEASRSDLAIAGSRDARVRFALETTERLLAALSDRQAARIGGIAGVGIGGARSVAARLYRVRLDMSDSAYETALAGSTRAMSEFAQTPDSSDEAELLAAYVTDGESYVADLEPWLSGGEPRTGDSYLWAILSILGNRAAQRLILTDPERADAQRTVGLFTADLYDRTFERLPEELRRRLVRDPTYDSVRSFDRTYLLEPGDGAPEADIATVYRTFVAAAQGNGVVRDAFSSSDPDLSTVSDVAHTYGLHVEPLTPDERDPVGALAVWFTLSASADNDIRGFGHAERGVLTLAEVVERRISRALASAGSPALRWYDSRLEILRGLLSGVPGFSITPGAVRAAIRGLYGDEPVAAPGAPFAVSSETEFIAEVMESVVDLETRLAEVEGADLRVLRVAQGVRR